MLYSRQRNPPAIVLQDEHLAQMALRMNELLGSEYEIVGPDSWGDRGVEFARFPGRVGHFGKRIYFPLRDGAGNLCYCRKVKPGFHVYAGEPAFTPEERAAFLQAFRETVPIPPGWTWYKTALA